MFTCMRQREDVKFELKRKSILLDFLEGVSNHLALVINGQGLRSLPVDEFVLGRTWRCTHF